MNRGWSSRSLQIIVGLVVLTLLTLIVVFFFEQERRISAPAELLSDPFLQLPTATSVRVIWFTEFAGSNHTVAYGEGLTQSVSATTTLLNRTREDARSRVGEQTQDAQVYSAPTRRKIWRHEAEVSALTPGDRIPYQVISQREDGQVVNSDLFTLTPRPLPNTPLKILLTSDHQLKPITAVNLQKVQETIGTVDAIFLAGDLVNIPDRASEWFDDNRGNAFFPCLQGRARYNLEHNGVKAVYTGGELIQHAPLFPAIGNHEVMGRFSDQTSLNEQFNDAYPRAEAEKLYQDKREQINPERDPKIRETWLKNNSFNTDTYSEIFTLPQSNSGGENYYAVTFGDIRLVVLYITNIWRTPSLEENAKGKYRERQVDLNDPQKWGYGQHIFEPIAVGSPQYRWLEQELNSTQFQQAKYKIVMFHHPPHSVGANIVPAYTDPVQIIERDETGEIIAVRYEYPKAKDHIMRDVMPLLKTAGVQLVLFGHSHLWNRFTSPEGIHFLESSNVGNTYGAYLGDKKRTVPVDNAEDYAVIGDPNGLEPIVPTLAPLLSADGQPLPYIASNEMTVFSILDTGTGTISSYYFDLRQPEKVVKFDEFKLLATLG